MIVASPSRKTGWSSTLRIRIGLACIIACLFRQLQRFVCPSAVELLNTHGMETSVSSDVGRQPRPIFNTRYLAPARPGAPSRVLRQSRRDRRSVVLKPLDLLDTAYITTSSDALLILISFSRHSLAVL